MPVHNIRSQNKHWENIKMCITVATPKAESLRVVKKYGFHCFPPYTVYNMHRGVLCMCFYLY